MQSKTSCFNASVFRKTVSRFWPIWGTYLAIGVLVLPFVILARRYSYQIGYDRLADYVLNFSHYGGLAMSAVFALFSAMAAWSFLFSTRAAHGMACLPLCRECVFFSAMLGGLVPLLAGNVIVYGLAAAAAAFIAPGCLGYVVQGFAIASLQMIFFFGFATFCAFLTGNILALPAVYVVLNFVFAGMELLVRFILSVFVYGMRVDLEATSLRWLSPVVAILADCGCSSEGAWKDDVYVLTEPAHFNGWGILLLYALAGLVFLALALLLLRRRRMEAAGDVVAIGILKPIFRWCMSIGCAVCIGCLLFVLFAETPASYHDISQTAALMLLIAFMLFGAFVGWFIGEMLLKKSFRVFRGKWGGLCICWALIAALMLACEFDLFGFERYVPRSEKTERVYLNINGEQATLTDPENIAAACALHEQIIAEKNENEAAAGDYMSGARSVYLQMDYILRDGRAISREYTLNYTEGDPSTYRAAAAAQTLMNCTEAIRSRKETGVPVSVDTVSSAHIDVTMTAAECAAAAGCPTAEDYVLRELMGATAAEMPDELRRELLIEAVNSFALDYEGKYIDYGEYSGYEADTPDIAAEEYTMWTPETGIPLDRVRFCYDFTITPAEAVQLYYDCIVPDMEDGTLGRVWTITDADYARTVYDASIHLQLHYTEDGDRYEYFYTVPTVDSVRTNAWLAERGVTLHTEGELSGENP